MGDETCVIAVDHSPNALSAFEWYVKHFHKPSIKVVLVHSPELLTNVTMMSPARIQELIKTEEENCMKLKDKFASKMKELNVHGEFLRVDGEKPGPAVVKTAKSKSATFVVTGTRGEGTIRRTIMGSVSDYIVHHSPIPVVVCRMKGVVAD